MRDQDKSKGELIRELADLRRRLADAKAGRDDPAHPPAVPMEDAGKQTEKAGSAWPLSESRLKVLFENTDDSIWAVDRDHCLTAANSAFRRNIESHLGRKLIPGESAFPESLLPSVVEEWSGYYDRALQGERFSVEVRRCCGDLERYVEYLLSPIRNDGDQVMGVTVFGRDVTERRQAEDALRTSESTLRSVLRAAPIGIGLVTDRVLGWTNERLQAMVGYCADEMDGRSARMLYFTGDEFDRVGHLKYAQIEQGGTGTIETRFRHKDGHAVEVLLSSTPIDADDLSRGVVFTALDIGERQRAEAALHRYTDELEILRQIGLELTGELNLEHLLNSIVSRAVELLDCTVGALYLYNRDLEALELVVADGLDDSMRGTTLQWGEGLAGRIWETGQPLIVDDYSTWPGRAASYDRFDFASVLGVPICWGSNFLGVLNVVALTSRGFGESDARLLISLATQAAIAINNARLFEAEREARRETEASAAKLRGRERHLALLNAITLTALEMQDVQTMLPSLAEQLAALLDADGCYIALWDETRQRVIPTVASRPLGRAYAAVQVERGEPTLTEAVLRAGHAIAVEDVFHSPHVSPRIATMFPARSLLGLPLSAGPRKLGAALIAFNEPRRLAEEEVSRGEQAARQIALALSKAMLLEKEREQRELAETLRSVASILNASLDREQVLMRILEQLARVVAYDNASVMLISGGTLEIVAHRGLVETDILTEGLKIEDVAHIRQVLAKCETGIIPDVTQDSRWIPSSENLPIRCWLGTPLVVHDQAIGLLNLGHNQPAFYTAGDAAITRTFADQAAIAIENAQLFEAEQQRRHEAEALRRTSLVLNSTLDLDRLLQEVLEQIASVISYDCATVMWVQDGEARITHQRGQERYQTSLKSALLSLKVAETPNLQRMFRTGRSDLVADTWSDETWIRHRETRWVRSWVGAPIVVLDKVFAFLSLDSATPAFFTGEDAHLLSAFAAHAAVAIENVRLLEEAKNAYKELKQAQVQLVQSAKLAAVGELAAGVAHELNNPLTSVLGFAELVSRDLDAQDPHLKDLEIVVSEARRARDIVRSLLDFARQVEPQRTPADLNQILEQTLPLIRAQLEKQGVTIVVDLAPDLPSLSLDSGQMKQVFLNLLTNAAQAMPRGGRLEIETRRREDMVTVSFSDEGGGIPPDVEARIFEPFFTTKATGTGLGLSVSLGIVEAHGGRIVVEGQVGSGSRFTVCLPLESQPRSRA